VIPPWVHSDLARELDPPAEVRALADHRSPEATLLITRALLGLGMPSPKTLLIGGVIPDAMLPPRYRPADVGTKCNFFTTDVAQLHRAPLPHRWRTEQIGALQWMSANDMTLALRRGLYPGWSHIEPARLGQLDVVERAAAGLPTVAAWFNAGHDVVNGIAKPRPGHIVWVVQTPPGKTGIYVTGAGRHCVDQCPIAQAFGEHVKEVEFYGHP
jgi:hypothetical protein